MDKNEFVKMMSQPEGFTSQDRGWLRAKLAKYPYSSVVRVLALMADHAYGFDTEEEYRATALSMNNAHGLAALVASAKPTVPEIHNFDILNEINTFQEVSFKTAPKSVILSNFLKIANPEEEGTQDEEVVPAESNDKKSLRPDTILGTETLAVVLEKQGKFDKALAIYEKLLARNPEKSSIFAPQIERLKARINSSK